MDQNEKETREELENRIQLCIMLFVCMVTAFGLFWSYSQQPIVIYNVNVEKKILVSSVPEEAAAASDGGETEASKLREVLVEKGLDINSASLEELEKLPEIGPVLAERILEYREENGGFLDTEELMEVEGIGETIFRKIEPYIVAK